MTDAELLHIVEDMLQHRSTVLFDTVAIHLAIRQDMAEMESLPLCITDDGYTRIAEEGKMVDCAIDWKDMEKYEDWLVERLTR